MGGLVKIGLDHTFLSVNISSGSSGGVVCLPPGGGGGGVVLLPALCQPVHTDSLHAHGYLCDHHDSQPPQTHSCKTTPVPQVHLPLSPSSAGAEFCSPGCVWSPSQKPRSALLHRTAGMGSWSWSAGKGALEAGLHSTIHQETETGPGSPQWDQGRHRLPQTQIEGQTLKQMYACEHTHAHAQMQPEAQLQSLLLILASGCLLQLLHSPSWR